MLPNYLAGGIRDAAVWYGKLARRGSGPAALRSPELKPKISFFQVFKMYQSVESIAKYQAALVGNVCLRRSILLSELERVDPAIPGNATGRILVLDTFLSTYDGLAAESSGGFFDESDCPPWDLWIDYEIRIAGSSPGHVRGLLSSWMPEAFFPIVEEAILVSGGDALSWGSESHAGLDEATIGSLVEELGRTVSAA